MSKIWELTKIMFKAGGAFGINGGTRRMNGRAKRNGPTALIFVGVMLLIAATSLTFSYYAELSYAVSGNFVDNFAKVMVLIGFVWTFAFMLNFSVSFFFLSTDNNTFLPMPLKPEEIFFARLMATLISAYIIQVIFLLPLFVAYDIAIGVTAYAVINQILLFAFNPLISLGLIFIIFIIMARIFNIQKHRKIVTGIMFTVMIILFIGAGISSSILSPSGATDAAGNPTPEAIQAMANSVAAVVNSTNFLNWFRNPFALAMQGANAQSMIYLVIYILIALAFFAVSLFLAKLLYAKVLVGSDDRGHRKKSKSVEEELKLSKSENTFQALVRKERKSVLRSGVYFSQLILPLFIMIAVYLIVGGVALYHLIKDGQMANAIIGELRVFGHNFTDINSGSPAFFIGALTGFLGSMVLIGATAISREGPNAYLMKIMPVNPRLQIFSKIFDGIIIDSVMLVVLILVAGIVMDFNWLYLIMMVAVVILNVIMINYAMVLIDLRRPMLHWTNEIIVTKQNLNSFLGMLVGWGSALVYIGIGILLYLYAGNYSAIYGVLLALAIPATAVWLMDRYVRKKGAAILKYVE